MSDNLGFDFLKLQIIGAGCILVVAGIALGAVITSFFR